MFTMTDSVCSQEPLRLQIIKKNTNETTASWKSQTNLQYNLQIAGIIGANQWRALSQPIPGNGATNFVDDPIVESNRFFRVVTIQNIVALKEENSGTTVQLGPTDVLEVVLSENRTTGFGWSIVETTPKLVEVMGEPKHETTGGGLGAGGRVIYFFEPVAVGQGQLKLIYHQSFNPDVPPAQTFEITVVVKSN
jgi:inhibitor of cysteine peptidase